jgi:hypothetical protein
VFDQIKLNAINQIKGTINRLWPSAVFLTSHKVPTTPLRCELKISHDLWSPFQHGRRPEQHEHSPGNKIASVLGQRYNQEGCRQCPAQSRSIDMHERGYSAACSRNWRSCGPSSAGRGSSVFGIVADETSLASWKAGISGRSKHRRPYNDLITRPPS